MEQEAAQPGYWDDPREAQKKMQQLGRLKDSVQLWRGLQAQAGSLMELTELALSEGDDSLQDQLQEEVEQITRSLAREEVNLTLSGPYDDRPAIVTIYAGAGGTDSQDGAEMLLGMYAGWGGTQRRPTQVMDLSYGDEAG